MKTGLVLSGGGSTGAYQAGVIKALDEIGMKFDIVTGASIGSINGAMYVTGDIAKTYDMWKALSFKDIFDEDIKYDSQKDELDVILKYVKIATRGGAEPSNLKKLLMDKIDLDKFYNSKIEYGLTTVNFPSLKLIKLTKDEIKREELFDYMIASSTVFPVFKLKKINNKKYVDGGVRDTMPYDLAIKMGAKKIVIVNISYFFKYAKIPKKILKEYDITIIRPKNKTGPSLMFEGKQATKNMQYGYNDGMKTFGKLYGDKYTFKEKPDDIKLVEYLGRTFKLDDSKIYSLNDFNKKIYKSLDRTELKEVKNIEKIRSILKPSERIKYIYNKLLEKDVKNINIIKKVFNKEYLAAYYIYDKYN